MAIEKLKAAKDPFIRRQFLGELRRLLSEVDSLIDLDRKPRSN